MIEKTSLPDVMIIIPRRFQDSRGFFSETWNKKTLKEAGIDVEFVQDNHSLSQQMGTVRGLHYQSPPHAQDKLVRVVSGRVLDVAVDIRVGSPHYGKWVGVELSAQNGKQLFIPKGFLHAFITYEPNTEVVYKCSDFYAPECDGAIRFDDPDLAIERGLPDDSLRLSDKDKKAPFLRDIRSPFKYAG